MPDSLAAGADSLLADSLTFEERLERYRQTLIRRKPRLSSRDSLLVYFASNRLNVADQRKRSFYHDAGDYLKFDPGFFVNDARFTPTRKTIQPYGLSGPRMSYVIDGWTMQPFGHVIEPDGLVDVNALPTAFDESLYIVPGAAGILFGADQSVAALVTEPMKPTDSISHSSILGEEGDLGWSWVRGRFTRNFHDGRQTHASVEYRDGDGYNGVGDHSYNYVGDFYFPIGLTWGAQARGQLYRDNGVLYPHVMLNGVAYRRFSRESRGELIIEKNNEAGDARLALGYKYLSQFASMNDIYLANRRYTGHAGYFEATKVMGNNLFEARIGGTSLEYDNWYHRYERSQADLRIVLAHLSHGLTWALVGGGRYDDEFDLQPLGALIVTRETNRSYLLLSAGYAERAPTLYERFLHFRTLSIFGSSSINYAESGNDDLVAEKQLIGSAVYEYGSRTTALRLSVTGGRITDGIDWRNYETNDEDITYDLFTPENGDVDFVDFSVSERLQLNRYMNLSGGVAVHSISYENLDTTYYTPDFQSYAGLELHLPWDSRKVDFYGYAELVYIGPYDGYEDLELGDYPLINGKLTLEMGPFRFFTVFENITSQTYRTRDYFHNTDQFFYYGIAWHFLD